MTGFNSKRQAALDKLFEAENELGLRYDERPEQEPVGFVGSKLNPPQRPWVGLTDDEIEQMGLSNYIKVVRETEAKLKE